jgi:hypothetical protein
MYNIYMWYIILLYIHNNIGSREPVARRIICVCVCYGRCCCRAQVIQRTATRHTYYINPIDIRAVRRQHPAAVEPHRRPDGGRPFSAGATFSYIIVRAYTHTTIRPDEGFLPFYFLCFPSHSRDDIYVRGAWALSMYYVIRLQVQYARYTPRIYLLVLPLTFYM